MFLRFESPLRALWILTDRREAARIQPDGPGWTERWTRLTPGRAGELLASRGGRSETARVARDALARTGQVRAHGLSDDEAIAEVARHLSHGWAVEIDRILPVGGWSDPDPPPPEPVPEAVEPEANPTGVPAKKVKDHFIIVELVGENGEPIPNELCKITLPGGDVIERETNSEGKVEEYNIEEGDCVIEFPELDMEAWEPATS
jgi:hypothetical protein